MYAGDVYKLGFGGRLLFSLSHYRFFGSSSRTWLWPALLCWHLLLNNSSCLLYELRQKLFDGGGWTAASFS
jgi:hypothetical protein